MFTGVESANTAIYQLTPILNLHQLPTNYGRPTMSTYSDIVQRSRQPSFLINTLLIVALILITLGSNSASANDFTGTVANSNGDGIQYVSVDVLGPRKIFTRTDKDGKFKVSLIRGKYTIRLRYKGRRKEFPIEISADQDAQTQSFTLNW